MDMIEKAMDRHKKESPDQGPGIMVRTPGAPEGDKVATEAPDGQAETAEPGAPGPAAPQPPSTSPSGAVEDVPPGAASTSGSRMLLVGVLLAGVVALAWYLGTDQEAKNSSPAPTAAEPAPTVKKVEPVAKPEPEPVSQVAPAAPPPMPTSEAPRVEPAPEAVREPEPVLAAPEPDPVAEAPDEPFVSVQPDAGPAPEQQPGTAEVPEPETTVVEINEPVVDETDALAEKDAVTGVDAAQRDDLSGADTQVREPSVAVDPEPEPAIVESPVVESSPRPVTVAPMEEQVEVVRRVYIVREGDSLSEIADEVYGDHTAFDQIYDANREVLNDPDILLPGQELSLPEAP